MLLSFGTLNGKESSWPLQQNAALIKITIVMTDASAVLKKSFIELAWSFKVLPFINKFNKLNKNNTNKINNYNHKHDVPV